MGHQYDATKEKYEVIELYGKQCLFTPLRIDRGTVPNNLYMYETRHDDEEGADPIEIGNRILVNFFGTIITNEEITLDNDGFKNITLDDFNYLDCAYITLNEFYKK